MEATVQKPAVLDLLSSGYRRRFLFVMFLVSTFNFADRAVFAAVAQMVKRDLVLSDAQLGVLQGIAFAAIYSLLGIPIGWLSERRRRLPIVTVCLAIWSVMTALCGGAVNFVQLLGARVGVGIGEAGFMSPVSSLVSDLFPRERRASAMSLVMLGTPVGTLLGAVAGGWIAQHLGWRAAFVIVGLPGLAIAALVPTLLREPGRGLAEGALPSAAPPPRFLDIWGLVVRKRALLFVLIGGVLAQFGLTSISQFMTPFLVRTHHLPIGQAAPLFGVISAISIASGLMLGSFGSERAGRRDLRWAAWGPVIGLTCATPLYQIAFRQSTLGGAVLFLILGGMSLLCYYGPTLAMLQNMVGPRMRATIAAVFGVFYSLIGLGLGPTFTGVASDRFAAANFTLGRFATLCPGGAAPKGAAPALAQACREASAVGLQHALTAATLIFVLAAVFYALASRTYRADIYRAEA
ncbi:MAG TPA: MFS transporter [Phenylobacterium sp.]|nr:MFS transporter [Phenylobacterium sp.]